MQLQLALLAWGLLALGLPFSMAGETPDPDAAKQPNKIAQNVVNAYDPYTHYAAAVECPREKLKTWKCGKHCDANPKFEVIATGGNGTTSQPNWLLGYDPGLKELIISHQDTDDMRYWFHDWDFELTSLDPLIFPNTPPEAKAYSYFLAHHNGTAPTILGHVHEYIVNHGVTSATFVGLGVGGAVAMLDGLFVRLQLYETLNTKTITYGMPMVGNLPFVKLVETHAPITHINNGWDASARQPFRPYITDVDNEGPNMPKGEISINEYGDWYSCPGRKNHIDPCRNSLPAASIEPEIYYGWHKGYYNAILFNCDANDGT